MCVWRYYYFGACQHHETAFHEFCANATEMTTDSTPAQEEEEQVQTLPLETADQDGGNDAGDSGPSHEGSRSQDDASIPSTAEPPLPSSPKRPTNRRTASLSFSISASSDHSFTPIPEETADDIASLEDEQKTTSPRRYSESAADDMASGLSPFGKSTFRQLMTGGGSPQLASTVTTAKNHNDREEIKPELNQQGGSLRVRQPGIRDQSDESYNLPDSDEILQHISGSCRGDFNSSGIGTDPHRDFSYGSDFRTLADQNQPPDSFDTIETDLHRLQAEITTLRADAKHNNQMDLQNDEQFPSLPGSLRGTTSKEKQSKRPMWPKKPPSKMETEVEQQPPMPASPVRNEREICNERQAAKSSSPVRNTMDSQSDEQFPKLPSPVRSNIPAPKQPTLPWLKEPASALTFEPEYEPRAAAMYERMAEAKKKEKERKEAEELERKSKSPERPPGAEHFPGLGTPSSTSSSQTKVWQGTQSMRKFSYASAASSGLKDAVAKGTPGSRRSIGSDAVSTVSGSRASRGSISSFNSPQQSVVSPNVVPSQMASDEGDQSVIISPQAGRQASKPAAWAATQGKQSSPRFAQPTKATTRRADETLRKDSAAVSSKVSPEGSPNKSIRTAVQRHQKRPSIPEGWTKSPEKSPQRLSDKSPQKSSEKLIQESPKSSPSKNSFHTAPGSGMHSPLSPFLAPQISSDQDETAMSPAASPSSPNASPDRTLRKKTSSYMSPTKATTRRTIETLGQENVKQASPRLSKATARIDTNISPAKTATSTLDDTPPAPLTGSTLASSGFEQHNITERVMQHLMTGKQCAPQEESVISPEGFTSRAPSSATASVFSSPVDPPSQIGRRFTVGSPESEIVAAKAKEGGLPSVANTTVVKRRGSHGHLLSPIFKKLDKQGLLKSPPTVPTVPEEHEPPVEESPLTTASSVSQRAAPAVPPGFQPGSNVFDPSHMRPHLPPHIVKDMAFQSALQQTLGSEESRAPKTGSLREPARHGSLRATAQEFRPSGQPQQHQHFQLQQFQQHHYQPQHIQPQHIQQDLARYDTHGILGYYSPIEWNNMSGDVRNSIQHLRRAASIDSPVRRPEDAVPSAYSSNNDRAAAPNAQDRHPSTAQSTVHTPAAPTVTAQQTNENREPEHEPYFMLNKTPRPYEVEEGAVIKPEIDPATNTVQWIKQSPDGRREAVSFGRAPAPDNVSPSSLTISPTSNDTSPPKPFTPSPGSSRRWRISSLMSDKYGWKGGDGLEISFRGSGANAERDPNPPSDVNFGYPRGTPARGGDGAGSGARFVGGGDEFDSPPLAPRSREQWAKLMGYPKVPCNEMVVDVFEMYPREYGPFGHCIPCWPDH